VEKNENTGATSRAPRQFTLDDLIDSYMAQYAGADPGIGARLAYLSAALGARNAAEFSSHRCRTRCGASPTWSTAWRSSASSSVRTLPSCAARSRARSTGAPTTRSSRRTGFGS
jgi:hypothetical protein